MKTNVLVIAEGAPNFWEQIAIGFHAAGCAVSLAVHGPDMVRDLLAAGRRFDLAVANQATMNALAVTVRDNRGFPWRNHLGGLVMVQFHDVFREIPTLDQASQIFSWVGLPLTYWIYCARSAEILRRRPFYSAFFLGDLPISLDCGFSAPSTARPRFILDVGPHLAAGPAPAPTFAAEDGPLAVYLGSCSYGLPTPVRLDGPLAPTALHAAVTDYVRLGRPLDRAGFIEHLLEQGRISEADVLKCFAGEYLCVYGATVALGLRLMLARDLKRRFGERFALYGDDWARLGVPARPTDFAGPGMKYRGAAVCLDFGSQFVDASLYQRVTEIIAAGGRLLQLRQPDGGGALAPWADLIGFDDADDAAARLERLTRPEDRETFFARHAAFADFVRVRFDPAAMAGRAVEGAGVAG